MPVIHTINWFCYSLRQKRNEDNGSLITSGVSEVINSVSDPEEAWSVVTKQAFELQVTGEEAA